MAGASTVDTIAMTALDTRFHQIEDRLVDEHGGDRRDAVRQLVAHERPRFSDVGFTRSYPACWNGRCSRLNPLDHA